MSRTRNRRRRSAVAAEPETKGATATVRELTTAERAFYGEGAELVVPGSVEELREVVRDASERRRLIVPAGLGRHAYLGNPPPVEPLVVSLARIGRVVRYEPADFTVGVEAGTSLETLGETLAENGQEIAVDWSLESAGTIGGAVAADLFGPRRARRGTFRNVVIGIAGMRDDGVNYRAGGMVVKNVAGYDVGKLLVGSLGTMGFILEINFKLRPLPAVRDCRLASFESSDAAWRFVAEVRDDFIEPAAMCVLDPAATKALASAGTGVRSRGWSVVWLLEGNDGTVDTLAARLEALVGGQATGVTAFDGDHVHAALEWLTAFSEPGDCAACDLAIVRLAALPTALAALERDVSAAAGSAGARSSVLLDAAAGVATVRLRGKPDSLAEAIGAITSSLVSHGASGRLLFAAPDVRQRREYLLVPDANARLGR